MKTLIILLAIFLSAAHAFAQEPVWSKKYHTGSVTCLDFSGDGGKLLSGSYDQTIRLWDISKVDTIRTFKSIKAKIDNVDFNKTGEWFIASWATNNWSGGVYNSFIVTNLDSVIKTIDNTPKVGTVGFAYPELSIGILSDNDSTYRTLTSGLKMYGPQSLRNGIIGNYNLFSGSGGILSENFGTIDVWCTDRDHKRVFAGGDYEGGYRSRGDEEYWSGFSFHLADFNDNSIKNVPYFGSPIKSAAFSFDESKLILSNMKGEIYLTEISSLNKIYHITRVTSPATALSSDMQERFYISAHEDSTLRLWTPGIPNIFKRIPLQSPVTTIVVSPDSVHFATAHTDGTVALWDIVALANSAPSDTVFTSVAEENPFKNTILSAEPNPFKNSTTIRFSLEKTLKIKLAVTDVLGREVAVLKDEFMETGEQNVVFKNDALPNGTYFITLSGDGLLKTIPVNIAR